LATRFFKKVWQSLLELVGRLQWGVASSAPLRTRFITHFAGRGDLRMLSWLSARGCPWPDDEDDEDDEEYLGGPCAQAATRGHISVLQWLHANGCPWDESTCSWAAEDGHLSMLQWLPCQRLPSE
jgi:hypothetical protein